MKGLAWDDKPDELNLLAVHFGNVGVELTTTASPDEFFTKLHLESWDFVLSDAFDESEGGGGETIATAREIIQHVKKKYPTMPVFILTNKLGEIDLSELELPGGIPVYSKLSSDALLARNIRDELERVGGLERRVALIYGHDEGTENASAFVSRWLEERGIPVDRVDAGTGRTTLIADLMNAFRPCRATIAICTPDDSLGAQGDALFQPRGNVLLEIGIAIGQCQTLEQLQRVIVIQQWDEGDPARSAQLPSDLGGMLTLRFNRVPTEDTVFSKLRTRLDALGFDLDDESGAT